MDHTSDDDLASSVQDTVPFLARRFDVDYVTLHLFRAGDDAHNKPYVRTNYPDAWVSHYLLNDYVRIDPVLQRAEASPAPFCWSTINVGPEHGEMMTQAVKHGVGTTGFSVSHIDDFGRRSVLSFNAQTAPNGATWEPILYHRGDELRALAADMHAMALAEIYGDGDGPPRLSPREVECLKWAAEGKAYTDIAIILDLSEHTVRSYLKTARIKLDSVTLTQAVAKAASLGVI